MVVVLVSRDAILSGFDEIEEGVICGGIYKAAISNGCLVRCVMLCCRCGRSV